MRISTKTRTDAPEIMDDFALEGAELRDALDKIAKINRLLGGNNITLQGVCKLIGSKRMEQIVVVDAGCGNGDMLRKLADFGKKHRLTLRLIGIDANAFTIDYARKLSTQYQNIEFVCKDIFSAVMDEMEYDIVLCTLTLHHFNESQIISLLEKFIRKAKIGIVVNDLQRSKLAYRLFQMICAVSNLNRMSKNDGLVSILRGFKRNELDGLSKKLNLKNYVIRWKWAFRYQWIISTK